MTLAKSAKTISVSRRRRLLMRLRLNRRLVELEQRPRQWEYNEGYGYQRMGNRR